jgi:hypothetical protein
MYGKNNLLTTPFVELVCARVRVCVCVCVCACVRACVEIYAISFFLVGHFKHRNGLEFGSVESMTVILFSYCNTVMKFGVGTRLKELTWFLTCGLL